MVNFIMAVTCPLCGETIIDDGFVSDYSVEPKNGIPVVDLSLFSCHEFICENCGTKVYTGDEESMYEYEEGEDPEDTDDDGEDNE
jgi:predicted RNA-binding Zn-ribbon protein involved in translation (DUF1610 family)